MTTGIVELRHSPRSRVEIFAACRPSRTATEWIVLMCDHTGESRWWGPAKDKESAERLAELLAPNFGAEFIKFPQASRPSPRSARG
jgi:hypothetical protein